MFGMVILFPANGITNKYRGSISVHFNQKNSLQLCCGVAVFVISKSL